jgi:hypothetical protein
MADAGADAQRGAEAVVGGTGNTDGIKSPSNVGRRITRVLVFKLGTDAHDVMPDHAIGPSAFLDYAINFLVHIRKALGNAELGKVLASGHAHLVEMWTLPALVGLSPVDFTLNASRKHAVAAAGYGRVRSVLAAAGCSLEPAALLPYPPDPTDPSSSGPVYADRGLGNRFGPGNGLGFGGDGGLGGGSGGSGGGVGGGGGDMLLGGLGFGSHGYRPPPLSHPPPWVQLVLYGSTLVLAVVVQVACSRAWHSGHRSMNLWVSRTALGSQYVKPHTDAPATPPTAHHTRALVFRHPHHGTPNTSRHRI